MNPPDADTVNWDDDDGFYYDVMRMPDGTAIQLKTRSLVGLLPMCAATVFDGQLLERYPMLLERAQEFVRDFSDALPSLAHLPGPNPEGRRILSLVDELRLRRILETMLDEDEFLGPHGIRAISRRHLDQPCIFDWGGGVQRPLPSSGSSLSCPRISPSREIHEPEAAIVRGIFDEYTAAGRSMRAITRRLYEQGVPTPTGRAVWSSSTLGGMLRNRSYMGTAEWFRHETVAPPAPGKSHGRQTRRPKEDWVRVPVPAIITEEVFEAAQRVKTDNSMFSPRRTTPGTWLLRGLVYCGACNVKAHAQPMRSTAENGTRKNRYYSCYHHDTLRAGGVDQRCTERRIRADELDAFVFAQVRDILLRPDVLLAGERALVAEQPAPDDEILDAQLARLTRRVDQATAERRRITDLYQAGHIDMPELNRRATELDTAAANSSPNRPSSQPSVTNSPSATASANASPTSPNKPQTGSTRSTSTNANDCSA